jgi:HlyD family secretion protein
MQTQSSLDRLVVVTRRAPRRKYIFLVAGLVLLAAAVAGFFIWQQHQKQNAGASQTTITVRRGSVDVKVAATGTIRPEMEVKVSPKAMGLIKKLFVKQGDVVKKGQPIAQMDDINLRAQMSSAEAAYQIAKDQYEKAQNGNRPQEIAAAAFASAKADKAVLSAKQNVMRLKLQLQSLKAQAERDALNAQRQAMLAQQGAVSDQDRVNAVTTATVTKSQLEMAQQELAQAETAVGQAEADAEASKQQRSLVQAGSRREDINAARDGMLQAKANMEQIRVQIDDMLVRAPFDGVITQKYADEGAIVTPTTSAATTSATSSSIVALAGSLEMVATVSEADISKIQLGQDVDIVANALPGKVYHGFVTQIAPEAIVNSNVTTFEVHAALDEPDKQLMAGMNVSAKFVAGTENNVLLVPTVAIVSRRGQPGVMVIKEAGKEPEWTAVTIGPTVDNQTVIRRGLDDGDKVAMGLSKDQLQKLGYSRTMGGGQGLMGPMGGMGRGFGGGGRRGGGH